MCLEVKTSVLGRSLEKNITVTTAKDRALFQVTGFGVGKRKEDELYK